MASFSYLPALYQRNLSFHFQKESRSLTDLKDFCSSSLRKSILRQLNQKGTSFSDFAGGYRDCPTMLLNNLSGQIQTDASSALFADFRRSPSVKPLEYFMVCAYRLYAVERKIDTKVRNIGQQKCYNDLRKRRRSLAWHEQRASRLKNFALVSARKRAAGRNYSGFGFQTALSARNAAVRNITQFAGGTRSSAVPADTRLPSPQKPLCTARICP